MSLIDVLIIAVGVHITLEGYYRERPDLIRRGLSWLVIWLLIVHAVL